MAGEKITITNNTTTRQFFSYVRFYDNTEQVGITLNPGQTKVIIANKGTLSYNLTTTPITIVSREDWPKEQVIPKSIPLTGCAINYIYECESGSTLPAGVKNGKPFFLIPPRSTPPFDQYPPSEIYWDDVNLWWVFDHKSCPNPGDSQCGITLKLVDDTPLPVSNNIINYPNSFSVFTATSWQVLVSRSNCFCGAGNPLLVTSLVDPTCTGCPSLCPDIFPWQEYNDNCCYWVETQDAIAPTEAQYSAVPVSNVDYSVYGSRIYEFGFPLQGNGTISATLTTSNIWKSTSSSDGPMNRCGIWTTEPNYNPLNQWIGFSTCITVPTSGIYYFGVAADNNFRAVINGTQILNTIGGVYDGVNTAFKWWHIYPVQLTGGDNILEIFGLNTGSVAGFGCVIYNNTYDELVNASTLNDLNEIFTTDGVTEFQIVQNTANQYLPQGFVCPPGFRFGCSGCVRYNYCCW